MNPRESFREIHSAMAGPTGWGALDRPLLPDFLAPLLASDFA